MIRRIAATLARRIVGWWRALRSAKLSSRRGGSGGEGPDAAGVTAKLKPRPPVLVAQFAQPLPESEEHAA